MNHFFFWRLLGGLLTFPATYGWPEVPECPGFGLVWPDEGPVAGGEAKVMKDVFAVGLPEYLARTLLRNASCS